MDVNTVGDEEIREILTHGITYLYRVTDSPMGLQQLILSIVDERRIELLALRAEADGTAEQQTKDAADGSAVVATATS
jgi:hypothetical protein